MVALKRVGKKGRQGTYNVTLKHVRATIPAVEKR